MAWGQTNRSALIRIPRYTKGRESATRCEFRSPDPSSNPYLAFTVMLAAGLDGIENDMVPPNPVDEDIFHLDDERAKELKIRHLPDNMWEAIKDLEKDEVIKNALGEHIFNAFSKAKRVEWFEYKTYVSRWEHDKYFAL